MKTYHILTLLVVFLFTGCLKEEKNEYRSPDQGEHAGRF